MTPTHVLFCNKLIPAADIEEIMPVHDNADTMLEFFKESPTGRRMLGLKDWKAKPLLVCWFMVRVCGDAEPPLYWNSVKVPDQVHLELQRMQAKYSGVSALPRFLEHAADDLKYTFLEILEPLRRHLAVEAYQISDQLHLEWHQALQGARGRVIPMLA